MKAVYQLWGLASAKADWDKLLRRLRFLQERCPAGTVICGIDAPEEMYRDIAEIVRPAETEIYLWFPLFSELDGLCEWEPLTDWEDRAFLAGDPGRGTVPPQNEYFRFRCPASAANRSSALEESLKRLKKGSFDGIFLDRMRYPSFQFGLSGVFSCFCPRCRERYRRMGLDADRLRSACARAQTHAEHAASLPFSFDGRWRSADADLQALLDARCAIITETMAEVSSFYHDRGLKVGFDLFTPSLAGFVGQDYASLLPMADLAKPMMYLTTDAPAGLPYELRAADEALGMKPGWLLSCSPYPDLASFARGEIRQTEALRGQLGCPTEVSYGFEYNRVMPIAPVGPEDIARTLALFKSAGAGSATASWSLFSAAEENLDAFLRAL